MKARLAIGWVIVLSLVLSLTGCGGNSTPGTTGTTVNVTFTGGTPVAIATQVGSGGFTSMTPGGQITLTVPSGTTRYAIAFLCPPITGLTTANLEIVIEATIQDSTTLTESCFAPSGTGIATGSASSAIAGTTELLIRGAQNSGVVLSSASGPFSTPMPTGPNDIAVVARDGSGNVLGIKIARSQTVPGTVGGSGIVLVPPGDATTTQSVTTTNVPAGFPLPSVLVDYNTVNGTNILLTNLTSSSNPMPYAVVPSASTQSGDFYHYFSFSNANTGTISQLVAASITTTTGGGAITLPLPSPWSFSGPMPAKLPGFTYNYPGFAGLATAEETAIITWAAGSTTFQQIEVLATANFQNGATTITIPDLSSLPGFLAPAPSGTNIIWTAGIFGGTQPPLASVKPAVNAANAVVQNSGSFTQP